MHKVSRYDLGSSRRRRTRRAARRGVRSATAKSRPSATTNSVRPQPANIPVRPFLSNPTSCGTFEATHGSGIVGGTRDRTARRDADESRRDVVGPIGECDRVPFEPSIEAQPSTRSAESPTGLEVSLVVPQTWENPFTISTANLKDTNVTLPEGMTANPVLAAGLGACTPAQYEAETASSLPGEGCPPESKIGSIEIETPLLERNDPRRDLHRHAL